MIREIGLFTVIRAESLGADAKVDFTSAMVLHKLSAAILVGAFLGLGESALPNGVIQRSTGLIGALGTGGSPPTR